MLKTSMLSVAVAVALGTVGCSSGGGSGDPATATASAGTAIDGILVGSTVCIDVNNNNICDAGEPTDPDGTDSKGKFQIPETTQTGPLLLIGGTDSGTGQAFTGMLKAPAGSTVVTPLTSAVQSLVESGKSAADAEANVKAALGIPTSVDLVNFDPFEEIEGANAVAAQIVLAKQTQLQVLVHTAAVTVAGADAETDVEDTMSSVFDAIVTNFDGAAGEVALDAAAVATATRTVADEVYADNAAARVATKVVAASTAEDAVRDADSAAETISGGSAADAVDNLNNAITLVNTTTEDAVAAAVAEAAANAVALEAANAGALAAIEALQDERDRLEAEIAAAKAAAVAAAQQAADDLVAAIAASDKAAYEAALLAQAQAEELAAAQAAAELAAAEAAAAAAQAEADIAAALAAAAQAQADAAAAQAAAELAAAELRELAAAQAAADAAAAADFAAAEAAAAQAAANAAAAIAAAEVDAIVTVAGFYAVQAANDATAARAIFDLNTTLYADVEAKAVIAENAASDAEDAVALAELVDTNTTQAIIHRDEAQTQAGVAVTALSDARGIKSAADLAVAAEIAVAAKVARIQLLVTAVTNVNNDAIAQLVTANETASQVTSDIAEITTIDGAYELGTILSDATTAATAAGNALSDAEDSAALIATAKTDIDNALTAVNEVDAQTAEVAMQAALVVFDQKIADAATNAATVASKLTEATLIQNGADAATAAAILAAQTAANNSVAAANNSVTAANNSVIAAEAFSDNPNAAIAISQAVDAAEDAATAATDAMNAANAAAIAITVQAAESAATAAANAATAAANAATAAANAAIAADEAEYPVAGADDNSTNVSSALETLGGMNFETDSLTALLASTKLTLGDVNNDEKVLAALIDIIEVINSDEVNALITKSNGDLANLDLLTKEDPNVIIEIATAATMAGGVEVLHTFATKLKSASDVIGDAFSDNSKVINYVVDAEADDNVTLNYTDSLFVRGAALSAATTLELAASYSYGDVSHVRVKTKTIDSVEYEYTDVEIDPVSTLSQSTFFAVNNTTRLAAAGDYLSEAATLVSGADTTLTTFETDAATVEDATKIAAAFNGNGVLVIESEEVDSTNEAGTVITSTVTRASINLQKVFGAAPIDRNNMVIPTGYLGYSDDAIAEHEKVIVLNAEQLAYDVDRCNGVAGTEPDWSTVDWEVYSQDEETPRDMVENLSIQYLEPTYLEGEWTNSWVDWNTCTVQTWESGAEFTGDFDLEPGEGFKDVVVMPEENPVYSMEMLEGKTFFLATQNIDETRYGAVAVFHTNGTRTFTKDGGTPADAPYSVNVDGELILTVTLPDGDHEYKFIPTDEADDVGQAMAAEMYIDGTLAGYRYSFATQAAYDAFLAMFVQEATIVADGDTNDWGAIAPFFTDPEGDVQLGGIDITAAYAAQDTDNLYLRIDRRSVEEISNAYSNRHFYLNQDQFDVSVFYDGSTYQVDVTDFSTGNNMMLNTVSHVTGTSMEITIPKSFVNVDAFDFRVFTHHTTNIEPDGSHEWLNDVGETPDYDSDGAHVILN